MSKWNQCWVPCHGRERRGGEEGGSSEVSRCSPGNPQCFVQRLLVFSVVAICSARSMLPLKISSNCFPKSLFMFNVRHGWMHILCWRWNDSAWLSAHFSAWLISPPHYCPFLLILICPQWNLLTGLFLNFCIHIKYACVPAETSKPANLLIPREFQWDQDKFENLGPWFPELASAHPHVQCLVFKIICAAC